MHFEFSTDTGKIRRSECTNGGDRDVPPPFRFTALQEWPHLYSSSSISYGPINRVGPRESMNMIDPQFRESINKVDPQFRESINKIDPRFFEIAIVTSFLGYYRFVRCLWCTVTHKLQL